MPAKKQPIDADSDSDEDDAQMRQFMEAADHTLLTNAMFQKGAAATADPKLAAPPAKSERHLDEQDAGAGTASDLHITEEMQSHIWRKLSSIIQNQIEFCEQKSADEAAEPCHDHVRLVSYADCYLSAEIVDTGPPGPKKKPTIKRRTLSEDKCSTGAAKTLALAAVAISGESIMEGKETLAWAQSKPRQGKLFEYKATDEQGHKLQALHPLNEFTERRLQNRWNEAKIRRRKKKK
ncbi:uncharacterized protein LOC117581237 [Drosophila guanche]|uniref:Uncharacterized protein n=1 Tax=Drosophila guanche TaxID=7266 RepID=A0A3B0JWF8_DROGU|nr:uncharacterized protein LOC117581237 [Drosophila guanche]SPP77696.1 Hypothetical predicted protein [Drosophila guanche]